MTNNDGTLIFPPGWTLHTGGPYLATPLIKGYVEQNSNLKLNQIDLNLELAQAKTKNIRTSDLIKSPSYDFLNAVEEYTEKNIELNKIVEGDNFSWHINEGLVPKNCNVKSSKSVRKHLLGKYKIIDDAYELIKPRLSSKVIAFSITLLNQLFFSLALAKKIKEAGFTGQIIFGGNVVTRLKDELQKEWLFDIIDGLVIWQGERALVDLLTTINSKKDWSDIPNLIWLKKGEFCLNKESHLKPYDFSIPNFEGLKTGEYWGENYLPIIGSRGCYYGRCSFCAIPFAYGNNGFLGNDSTSNLYLNIQNGLNLGVSNFKFMDEAMHPVVLKKLCTFLIRNDIKIQFEGYGRIDSFWTKKENLELFSKAGLKKVYLGLEIISNNRDALKKKDSIDILHFLEMFAQYGIKVHLFTMFGYPGTTVEDGINTIEFCLKNQSIIDTIDVFPFSYAKHTEIDGIKAIIGDDDWALEFDYINHDKSHITQIESEQLCEELEDVVWDLKPEWLHPLYRMLSPWRI